MLLLLVLVYIHGVFSKQPTNCLQDIEHAWPKDGILRVEILYNASHNHTLEQSYKREYGAWNYHHFYSDPLATGGASNTTANTSQALNDTVDEAYATQLEAPGSSSKVSAEVRDLSLCHTLLYVVLLQSEHCLFFHYKSTKARRIDSCRRQPSGVIYQRLFICL